jgi:hypothetical protein
MSVKDMRILPDTLTLTHTELAIILTTVAYEVLDTLTLETGISYPAPARQTTILNSVAKALRATYDEA